VKSEIDERKMSKSKIPVRDLTPMFQVPSMDRESGHRSRRDRQATFSANFSAADRSKSHERHHRSNEKVKDLRNLVRKSIRGTQSDLFSLLIDFPKLFLCS
jgi:hypothetical protein